MTTNVENAPKISLEEQKKILLHAIGLIREPETWVQGSWKCPVPETKNGKAVLKSDGSILGAKDRNGNDLYQYCIEGAVNQATYDILGEERALALGAAKYSETTGELIFQSDEHDFGWDPTLLLGLDEISKKLYGCNALEYNDHDHEDEDTDPSETHKGVLGILNTGLRQVTDKLKTKKELA
jgi:hypothetical protein